MKNYYFGGKIYTSKQLTNLTADLDALFKAHGQSVQTSYCLNGSELTVHIPVKFPTHNGFPDALLLLIVGAKNMPPLPIAGLNASVWYDHENINEIYRKAKKDAGFKRYGSVDIFVNGTGVDITLK